MATAPLDPAPADTPASLRLHARVGMARWTVLLPAPTVARLAMEHPGETGNPLSPVAVDRVMEGLRAKAVGMRWYGGGALSIDPEDLGDGPAPGDVEGGVDAAPLPVPQRWYDLVEIAAAGQRDLRLIG